jgi:hypothetical protein
MNGFAISKEFGVSYGLTVLFVLEKIASSKAAEQIKGKIFAAKIDVTNGLV